MPGVGLTMDLERIECFLDVRASIGDRGAKKRLDLDEFVTDNLETKNTRVLMKRIHSMLKKLTAPPDEEEGMVDDDDE
jgi:hypothetical protein